MEISDIRRRVLETVKWARRQAAERRTRIDEATREYATFLDQTAVPVFKQVANVLRAHGYMFTVFTPGGRVRLMSDRAAEDYIEIVLGTGGSDPAVICHASRGRGRRVVESEQSIGPPATLTDNDVLTFVLRALEPLVER